MNILIVGSGAREHVIAQTFKRSHQSPTLFCCGTSLNPGLLSLTKDYWVGDITQAEAILTCAQQWEIDLAIIGPEAPLAQGVADRLWLAYIPTVGPKKALARIESSKGFARALMKQYQIPGLPRYQSFSTIQGANALLEALGEGNYVIKADGLMSGKGVRVAGEHLHSFAEALAFCEEIIAQGQTFIIEEKLVGQEFSFMCFCDGQSVVPMPLVQDHKRAYEGDKGPNTGGMGSYSDANHALPFLTDEEIAQAALINQAVITALNKECQDVYQGILYGSYIATASGVYVIEFNARFGDPEALNVLPLLVTDFVSLCDALVAGRLSPAHVSFLRKATVCKYIVPQGYPDNPIKNQVIDCSAVENKAQLYFAGVHASGNQLMLTGARSAACVGIADTLEEAEKLAETEISKISGPVFHRGDIGKSALIQSRMTFMKAIKTSCA